MLGSHSKYEIKLDIFEGPLDLLLHLIKKNKINIYDIPISLITKQYLEYIKLMKILNLEVASEFILMAAILMDIKSAMLLPKVEDEEEEEDPREELVRMLVEYKKYKEAGLRLLEREILNRDTFLRGNLGREREENIYYEDISIFQLMDAFKRVMDKISKKSTYDIRMDEGSIKEEMENILSRLRASNNIIEFEELIPNPCSKRHLILIFLALLELARLGIIRIYQALPFERINILLKEDKKILMENQL